MLENVITPESIVKRLNSWLQKDPTAVLELFVHSRVKINKELANDKFFVCIADKNGENYQTGPLGFINGFLPLNLKIYMTINCSGSLERFELRENINA